MTGLKEKNQKPFEIKIEMTPEVVMPKENLDLIKFSRISDTSRKRCFIILIKHSYKGEDFTGNDVSKTDFIFGFIIFFAQPCKG